MYQRGIKLGPLSQALHELSGIKTVFLRRQTRRGMTHLLLVGKVSGISFSRRIPEADPTRPEAALAKAVQLIKQIGVDGLSGSAFSVADRTLEAIHRRARQSIVAEEHAELIRSSTAQSRLRWIQRGASFLEEKGWGCEQRTLEQWILQTDRGSRVRRERLTAARTLAEATGFEFVVKPEAKYSTKHAPLVQTKPIDEKATLAALKRLTQSDYPAGWAMSFCYATGIRLRGVMAINPADLEQEIRVGSVIRYWDGKVGRQKLSEAIISTDIDWLSLQQLPNDLTLAPWFRVARADEHNALVLQASRIRNRVATILGDQNRWVAARYLRRLVTRRLLIAGVHPLQVCKTLGTSLPILEKRYADLFVSEAVVAIKSCMSNKDMR
jgi:integrase